MTTWVRRARVELEQEAEGGILWFDVVPGASRCVAVHTLPKEIGHPVELNGALFKANLTVTFEGAVGFQSIRAALLAHAYTEVLDV